MMPREILIPLQIKSKRVKIVTRTSMVSCSGTATVNKVQFLISFVESVESAETMTLCLLTGSVPLWEVSVGVGSTILNSLFFRSFIQTIQESNGYRRTVTETK